MAVTLDEDDDPLQSPLPSVAKSSVAKSSVAKSSVAKSVAFRCKVRKRMTSPCKVRCMSVTLDEDYDPLRVRPLAMPIDAWPSPADEDYDPLRRHSRSQTFDDYTGCFRWPLLGC
jgi:hypothetical protein